MTEARPARDREDEPEALPADNGPVSSEAVLEEGAPRPSPQPAFMPKPAWLAVAYMAAAVVLSLSQGLGLNLINANITQIQGEISATSNEALWMVAAYIAPNVSLSLALVKIRTQYGLRNFAEISILGFVLACVLNLFIHDLSSAIVVRFMSGIAAAPMSSLGFLYMLEAFPPERKLTVGLSLALTNISLGAPLARIISPALFDMDGWRGLTMHELALAMIGFCLVYLLPLTPPPRAKVIERLDVLSYLLIAIGFGCLAVALVLGRAYWWLEAPWLGVLLAMAIVLVTAAVVIELNRSNPLVDVRWLASPAILHFAGALLLFRIVLSEQTTGASGLFQVLGLTNDQTVTLYVIILLASVAGGLTCAAIMKAGREPAIHLAALALIAVGAFMDSRSTNLTRPEQMFVSQAMIAFAGALFLPPAMFRGITSALQKGPNYILSFIIVFLTTQSIGGLLGSAVIGTFITIREKFHSNVLVEHLAMTDPIIAQRAAQLGMAYARTITDQAILRAEGLMLVGQQVTREANILAYNDAFVLMAIIAVTAFVFLLIHIGWDAMRRHLAHPQATANL